MRAVAPGQAAFLTLMIMVCCACGSAGAPGRTPAPGGGGATAPSGGGSTSSPAPAPSPTPQARIQTFVPGLTHPQGVAVTQSGLVVADTDGNRLVWYTAQGLQLEVSGSGLAGFGGDGGPASAAHFHHPTDVVVDPSGVAYVSDTDNNRVRQIDPLGVVTTVAGDGRPTFGGDGGPGEQASLYQPTGLALDPVTGDLFIADALNHRVRRLSQGIITTVAGTGEPGFSGDYGPATSARLRLAGSYFRLGALAVDRTGMLFIADSGNHCVRRVDPSGVITRVVGEGRFGAGGDDGDPLRANLAFPAGLALDPQGSLLISDTANSSLRRVSTTMNRIWHVAGDGTPGRGGENVVAADGQLHGPMGVAVDSSTGVIYVTDVENDRVRVIRTPTSP